MTDSFLTNIWIIAFAFLVIFPFDIYDLCKKKDRTWKNYVEPAITAVIVVAFLAAMVLDPATSLHSKALAVDDVLADTGKSALINHKIFWLLIAIVYMGGIYELVSNKYAKRDILFVCLSTVAILIYVVLYNI